MNIKSALRKSTLALAGLACGLLLAEAGLRLYGAYFRLSRSAGAPRTASVSAVKVLCVGDSFTYGMGAPAGSGYPEHLQKLLDAGCGHGAYAVINAGVPAQNSSELADRIDYLLAAHRPHFVIILTGANNYSLRDSNFFLFAPEELSFTRRAALRADALFSSLKTYKFFKLGAKLLAARVRARTYSPPPCSTAAQAALSEAMKENDRRDFKKATAIMEQALLRDENCAELRFQAGRMRFYFRDFPGAFDHFRKGRQLDPRHPFVDIFLSQEIPLLRPESSRRALDKLLRYDLQTICKAARRGGARPLIQTYPFVTDAQRDAIRAEAAAETGTALIDQHKVFIPLMAGGKFRDYLSGDEPDLLASHPDSRGYELMAETIYAAIKQPAGLPAAVSPKK